jgi:hypothetical protein
VALIGLAGLFLLMSPVRLELLMLAFGCVAATLILNRDLYAFFRRAGGIFFAVACVPLHLLYFMYCGLSYYYVWVLSMLQRAVARRAGKADPSF